MSRQRAFLGALHSKPSTNLSWAQVMKIVKVNRSDILDTTSGTPSLRLEVRRRLDEIAAQTLAHIAVVNGNVTDASGAPAAPNECNFKVKGSPDAADLARVRLLVMLDELVSRRVSTQIQGLR